MQVYRKEKHIGTADLDKMASECKGATMERQILLENWLKNEFGQKFINLQPMPGDASFRRYFRLNTPSQSYVVMDAKPPQEDCQKYIDVAEALGAIGLNVPKIFHAEKDLGFLLITDFGDLTYLKSLNHLNADQLYQNALQALAVLQTCRHVPNRKIPCFTSEWMWQEWAWCKEWFLGKYLDLLPLKEEKKLDDCYAFIVESAINQPQVFMHRDYHSANLMVLPQNKVGILDFQDAFIGPVTYDVVSLLRDCYIHWPEEKVRTWTMFYWQQLNDANALQKVTFETFLKWFDLMGIERHLKALFTFARKYVRDNQDAYLKYMPLTLNYLLNVSQNYSELSALHHYLAQEVQPALKQARFLCAQ